MLRNTGVDKPINSDDAMSVSRFYSNACILEMTLCQQTLVSDISLKKGPDDATCCSDEYACS